MVRSIVNDFCPPSVVSYPFSTLFTLTNRNEQIDRNQIGYIHTYIVYIERGKEKAKAVPLPRVKLIGSDNPIDTFSFLFFCSWNVHK